MMRRLAIHLVLPALFVATVSSPASSETLHWARSADALTLDPHAQNNGVTSTFLNAIYETLVERDPEANLVPWLANETDVEERDRTVDGLWQFVKDERLCPPLHNQVTAWALRDGIAINPDPSNSPKFTNVTFAPQ